MKVTDIRRKLAAALAAGGMLAPSAIYAANLDTNLIANPGFEEVDFNTVSSNGAPVFKIWSNLGFGYSHDGNSGIGDYANGGPLAGGGSWYFYPGRNDGAASNPSQRHHSKDTAITQTFSLAGGATGSLIASGKATYNLGAFFSSYDTQQDYGVIQVDFLNASNAVLGSGVVSPGQQNLPAWTQFTSAGFIPVGTTSALVSAWGVPISGSADGYMDNLDFRVIQALSVNVNRTTGAVTLQNQSGVPRNISGYTLTSDFEGLKPGSWLSVTDNYDNGNAGPNQVDPTHAWSETSNLSSSLAESDPATAGASLADGRSVNLGNIWIQNPNEDLYFQYVSGGQTITAPVTFTGGPGNAPFAQGDLNADGAITSADWVILRTNQHTNLSSKSLAEAYRLGDLTGDKANNHDDFVAFKTIFDAVNGVGAFTAMVASTPEPASGVLLVGAGLALPPVLRHPRRD
jgi:hypothetical protein